MCCAVHFLEFPAGAALPVEELQHHNPRDVFLQIGVDLGDRHADPPVALRHAAPEDHRGHNHERHRRQHDCRQQRTEAEHDAQDENQHQHIAQNRHQSRSEKIVQHIHVGSHASHQAAHRIAIVERQVEILQVLHELAAQIEHGELAGILHQVRLHELADEAACQHRQVQQSDARQPARCIGGQIAGQKPGQLRWIGRDIPVHRGARQ